jgi:hypothetical protein
MFNYATYNGIPIITYGLIGLTASILGLVTLNPSILELKEDGTQTTVSDAIGLDKISMPELPSYLPGLNGLPQPFTGDKPDTETKDAETKDAETKDSESDDESVDETDDESDYESEDEDDEPISDQSSVMNPLRKPSGGRKTRNKFKKNKKRRKTKRRK